jgi:hypothetical protein
LAMYSTSAMTRVPDNLMVTPAQCALHRRNSRAQGDLAPTIRHSPCSGMQISRHSAMPVSRRQARSRDDPGSTKSAASTLAVKRDPEQFHAVVDQPVAQPLGDFALQCLQLRVDEFDHPPALDIDQMVVMRLWRGFVA